MRCPFPNTSFYTKLPRLGRVARGQIGGAANPPVFRSATPMDEQVQWQLNNLQGEAIFTWDQSTKTLTFKPIADDGGFINVLVSATTRYTYSHWAGSIRATIPVRTLPDYYITITGENVAEGIYDPETIDLPFEFNNPTMIYVTITIGLNVNIHSLNQTYTYIFSDI